MLLSSIFFLIMLSRLPLSLITEVDPLLAASECSLLNEAIPTDIALLIRLGFLGSFFPVLSVARGGFGEML